MMTEEGLVTGNTGSRYQVELADGRTVTCAAKGNLRLKGVRTTNPVAVGDRWQQTTSHTGCGLHH